MISLILAVMAANPFDQFDAKPLAFPGPAKLIITWYQSNVTVIDYPNAARCEVARTAVQAEADRRTRETQAAAANAGAVVLGRSSNGAFCVPG